tara:strand:+ start:5105 stop:5710 length:606 start_codon:yes stop_codon:yes gene_type:complete
MASKVDIANFALNIIGATTISSLTENVKAATVINQRFDSVRDAVFRAHPWNSLINRASLSQDTTSPAFGYTYQYLLPTDPACLRVLEFSNGTLTYPMDNMQNSDGLPVFVIESKKLLTNEGTAKIKYIAQVTDTTQYDSSLIETLSSRLAHEICYAITGSTSLTNTTYQLYQEKLKEARFVDATEGAPQRIEASDFIESRF